MIFPSHLLTRRLVYHLLETILMSQMGATAVHIGLLEFLDSRGVHIEESYQLDVGGGSESINTLEKTRDIKRTIKTEAVKKHIPYDFELVSGSADFVDFLVNGRDSFFYVKGSYFGGAEFTLGHEARAQRTHPTREQFSWT